MITPLELWVVLAAVLVALGVARLPSFVRATREALRERRSDADRSARRLPAEPAR